MQTALTHKSASTQHYEKLEFLGDSILNYCISSLIFKTCTQHNEGKLSILRSRLVNKTTLSTVGKTLGIDAYIRVENQKISPAIRSDVVEAIVGAIYLDKGIIPCQEFITQHFSTIMLGLQGQDLKDPKSHLQELAHQQKKSQPIYHIIRSEGESHNMIYTVACEWDDITAYGQSNTKRQAEKLAAHKILKQLKEVCHE